MNKKVLSLWKWALGLAIFTIIFNIAEGIVSIYFGLEDEALTLFGFGLDSFVETISALGVAAMIFRIRRNPNTPKGNFEVLALRITGWCFYALSVLLAVGIVNSIITGSKPESTMAGIIISLISIALMVFLIIAKKRLGRKLDSAPIIADANCNLVCVYMSIVLLVSSAAYELFGLGFIDILGTAGIIYFSVKEGIESFQKAKGISCDCEAC
jgi:divalent metal cation (Fe/Co/Zn/Cd) transporter